MDNVDEKFANVVDYDAFSVRIAEKDVDKVLSSPARQQADAVEAVRQSQDRAVLCTLVSG